MSANTYAVSSNSDQAPFEPILSHIWKARVTYMPGTLITSLRIGGFLLMILVGYHVVNADLGLTTASASALFLLGACLSLLYQGYSPNGTMIIGWAIIVSGCFSLATFDDWAWSLLIPFGLFPVGYWLAGLPIELGDGAGGEGTGSEGGGDMGSGDGGGGN